MPKPKRTTKRAPKPAKALRNAQPSYVLKFKAPKQTRSAKAAPVSADTIAKLQAMAAAGILPGLPKQTRGASPFEGGFDIAELLKLYAKFKPMIDMILPLIQGLFKKDPKPVPVPDRSPTPEPTPDEIDGPAEAERVASRLEAKVFWIARKKTPHAAGGGRYLLSDEGKQKIVSGSDPLQSGDRVCFDVSPYDQNGVKFEGPKPVVLEHVVGGVGELQTQEENDYTPVVLAPWEGEAGQPGFQGELTYQARGGGLETKVIRLRVRPWA